MSLTVVYCSHVNAYIINSGTSACGYTHSLDTLTSDFNNFEPSAAQ